VNGQNFKRKQASDDGGSNKKKKIDFFSPTQGKEENMLASQSNQMKFHQLVALWTALSLRPFGRCEMARVGAICIKCSWRIDDAQ
jgi:hypothetical protein